MAKNKAERQAALNADANTETTQTTDTVQSDANIGGEKPAAATAEAAPAKTTKSIVPAKYANKYKAGSRDALGTFIDEQCVGKEGFEFPAFFNLCRINGIADEKVKHYEGVIAAKAHGGEGRTRMTLRNMLATIARKNGKLKAQDGSEVAVEMPKVAVSGAAAKAQETAAAPQEAAA